jgi:hypothetical protein
MPRPVIWRVRVKRAIEAWVDVATHSAADAEVDAAKVPGVISVFAGSAIRGDDAVRPELPEGVRE